MMEIFAPSVIVAKPMAHVKVPPECVKRTETLAQTMFVCLALAVSTWETLQTNVMTAICAVRMNALLLENVSSRIQYNARTIFSALPSNVTPPVVLVNRLLKTAEHRVTITMPAPLATPVTEKDPV